MQAIQIPITNFQPWKVAKVREQLNQCLIKCGYAPSHLLYNRTTVISNAAYKGREEFYLDYGTEKERFLFSASLLFDDENTPFLLFQRFDHREVLHHFYGY